MRKSSAIGSHPMTRIMRNAEEERMASIIRNQGKPRKHTSKIKDIAYEVAKASYKPFAEHNINEYQLVHQTPTLKFYENPYDGKMVVAIRGTNPSDPADLYADTLIAIGKLTSSNRYKKDAEEVRRIKYKFPSHKFYGVGHSLGGAILDAMIDEGLLLSGLSYNPAVESKHSQSEKNARIYKEGDPLHNIMGKGSKVEQVKEKGSSSIAGKVYDYTLGLTPFGKAVSVAYRGLKAHQLGNFSDVPIDKDIEGKE